MNNNIAVVGGFRGFENNPESNDYRLVMPTLRYLRRSGIAISDQPNFDTINFEDRRNFLKETDEYDIIFIAHIPNGTNLSWTRMEFNRYSEWTDVSNRKKLENTIAVESLPDEWNKRINQSGAALVITLGTYIEVEQNYLTQSQLCGFQSIISPRHDPSLVGIGDKFERTHIEKIYGEPLDIPFQWLGIGMRKDFMCAHHHAISNGATDLSKKVAAINFQSSTPAKGLQFRHS